MLPSLHAEEKETKLLLLAFGAAFEFSFMHIIIIRYTSARYVRGREQTRYMYMHTLFDASERAHVRVVYESSASFE